MFGNRLEAALTKRGHLCAGIDPHPQLIESWGLKDSADGLRTFAFTALDGFVAAAVIKPQSAFFERHGSAGLAVLEDLLAAARERGQLCILDVKRGDIGSTMDGYADAYLREDSPFAADAITVSPYMGPSAYDRAARIATENGKGLFLLCLTSNPEGRVLQRSTNREGATVALQCMRWTKGANERYCAGANGSFGLVIGATVPDISTALGHEIGDFNGPILVPGIGAQGGDAHTAISAFKGAGKLAILSTSRALLSSGPHTETIKKAVEKFIEKLEINV